MAGLDKLEANWAVRELKTTKVHMENLIKSKKRIVFSEDLPAIEEYFNFAALNCEVESYSQRQSFKKLFPTIYALRNKGISMNQITDLLNQSGFSLKLSTVRDYYRTYRTEYMAAQNSLTQSS